ncbi:MAG TPA: glycogen synthase GlgA [bacterium]|nr:glycogen synthase GlgA [bacterium]
MDTRLRVLMVAAEAHPLAKVGGLADVMGALPKALAGLGQHVRIAMPYYGTIKDKRLAVERVKGADLKVPVGDTVRRGNVWLAQVPGSQVTAMLIENDHFFGRAGIYGDPKTGKDYPDNAERFIFFSKAVVALAEKIKWGPDIIHCHDHQVGLIPAWLKTSATAGALKQAATVFTIHNLAYQGLYPIDVAGQAGFGSDLAKPMGPLEFYGKLNMMKAGIVFADSITTVSPTYASEIQTSEFGHGLEGVLKSRREDLVGILNGADYEVWDPATDGLLPSNYSSADLAGKTRCKASLIKQARLKCDLASPLVGIVSRLVEQKGFDILTEAMDAIMGLGLSLVVLGTGEKKYQDALAACAKRFRGRLSLTVGFDEELAHLIEAGCDMFLMPSKFEPCGLNQMYSMKYGTIPVVRKTGGLADSVTDFDEGADSTGFLFAEYSARSLLAALERARKVFVSTAQWKDLVARAMARDFSWTRSAKAYQQVYTSMVDRKRAVSRS